MWSDSEVALAWIRGKDKQWKPWVQNRVDKINEICEVDSWHYVNTAMNPADIGTREETALKMADNDLWWYGPSCITKPIAIPQAEHEQVDDKSNIPEVNSTTIMVTDSTLSTNTISNIVNMERFSSLQKMLRVTVYVLRFVESCLKGVKNVGEITFEEMEKARKLWIYGEQKVIMADKKFSNLKKQLCLFTDDENVIRLKGRLEYSHLPYNTKYPILLNRHSYFTKLIILHAHYKVKHMRVKSTLNEIRTQYWICSGK